MNCYDCAAHGQATPAVAICADCGAGLCGDHAHLTARWLTRTLPIDREVPVEPPARVIRCGICQAAREAAAYDTAAHASGRRRSAQPTSNRSS